jgi:hypothetical protein
MWFDGSKVCEQESEVHKPSYSYEIKIQNNRIHAVVQPGRLGVSSKISTFDKETRLLLVAQVVCMQCLRGLLSYVRASQNQCVKK